MWSLQMKIYRRERYVFLLLTFIKDKVRKALY